MRFAPIIIVLILAFSSVASAMEVGKLTLFASGAPHVFSVEHAHTEAQRQMGLMHRSHMAADHGMVFDFGPNPQPIAMWMKNTLIPLDMIFVGASGEVLGVATHTTPHSLTPIVAPSNTRYVVELNAGVVDAINLKTGDLAQHALWQD